jgi:hypothetical protein
MDSTVIHDILTKDPHTRKIFKGFSTPDVPIPKLVKTPAIFILNTDKSDGPGIHWCVAFFKNKNLCEFFDPLGKNPVAYGFDKPIHARCKNITFNEYPVQHVTAATCGHHCIFFAFHRARKLNPRQIMRKFSTTDLVRNDHMVFNFVARNFGKTNAKLSFHF